jgi:hypothetical protein
VSPPSQAGVLSPFGGTSAATPHIFKL